MKGQPVFTQEEMKKAYPPIKTFFEDGVAKDIVILKKEIVDYTSKAGKDTSRVDWTIADNKNGEVYEIKDFVFVFTNAMRDFKESMKFETSVYRVMPTKTGEYRGFPTFEYMVEYVGEDGNAPIPVPEGTPDVKDLPF